MTAYERMEPKERYDQIIGIALEMAERKHFLSVTPSKVGALAGCTKSLVSHYLGNLDSIQAIILQEAINRGIESIIEQGQRLDMITNAGNLKKRVKELIKIN